MRRLFTLVTSSVLVASCAAGLPLSLAPKPALPTTEEVHAYVRTHWNDDWNWRFANGAGRSGEAVSLSNLGPVSCSYTYDFPDIARCQVQLTGRLGSGEKPTLIMHSHFERDATGKLVEAIVLSH